MTAFIAVVPARHASTRLPAKPLADIGGKPMVVRVAERAQASGATRVCVATDHEAIRAACAAHGVEALMTRADHASGTDRIAEVADRLALADDAIVVNVQGDEPLIPPELVRTVAERLAADPAAAISTASHPIESADELVNPNVVKVVADAAGRALYFSRAPIPYARDAFAGGAIAALPTGLPCQRHVGIYAYRVRFLKVFAGLAPCAIERFEALEQLRALWHGHRIVVAALDAAPPAGVDTPADLERVRALFG